VRRSSGCRPPLAASAAAAGPSQSWALELLHWRCCCCCSVARRIVVCGARRVVLLLHSLVPWSRVGICERSKQQLFTSDFWARFVSFLVLLIAILFRELKVISMKYFCGQNLVGPM
jgi:hypothetical protein